MKFFSKDLKEQEDDILKTSKDFSYFLYLGVSVVISVAFLVTALFYLFSELLKFLKSLLG